MRTRRPSPVRVAALMLVACLLPVGVSAAVGLGGDPAGDRLETAAAGARTRGGAHVPARDMVIRPEEIGEPARRAPLTASDPGGGSGTTTTAPTTTTTAPTTTTTAPPTTDAPPPPATEPPTTAPPATTPPASGPADAVVDLANAARAQAGCGPLSVDDRLTAAAQGHSDDMAAQDYFSHTSLDGRTFADRIGAAGYPRPGGENIARGQRGAQAVHDAWMGSAGHRANILNCDFTAIGVGLHAATWTWTQNFGY